MGWMDGMDSGVRVNQPVPPANPPPTHTHKPTPHPHITGGRRGADAAAPPGLPLRLPPPHPGDHEPPPLLQYPREEAAHLRRQLPVRACLPALCRPKCLRADAVRQPTTNQPTHKQTNKPTHIHKRTNQHTPTNQPTNKPTHKPTNIHRHKQTNKPTNQPTNKQTNKPTHKRTNTHTNNHHRWHPYDLYDGGWYSVQIAASPDNAQQVCLFGSRGGERGGEGSDMVRHGTTTTRTRLTGSFSSFLFLPYEF